MDTVTHGIAGSILARSLTDRAAARAALVLGLVGGMLPDLDLFFLHGRIAYLRGHRGWTHTFLMLPVFALVLAVLARFLYRYAHHVRIRVLFLFAALGILSHIVFDWITSFGIMFWIPFPGGVTPSTGSSSWTRSSPASSRSRCSPRRSSARRAG